MRRVVKRIAFTFVASLILGGVFFDFVSNWTSSLRKVHCVLSGCAVWRGTFIGEASYLASIVPLEDPLTVILNDRVHSSSVRKSLRQIVLWHKEWDKTRFISEPQKVEGYILVENSEKVADDRISLARQGKFWSLYCSPSTGSVREGIDRAGIVELAVIGVMSIMILWLWRRNDSLPVVMALLLFSVVVFLLLLIGRITAVGRCGMGIIMLGIFALVGGTLRQGNRFKGRRDVIVVSVLFILLAPFALAQPLSTPNVASVVAGKAKLFFLQGGVPQGFWSGGAPYSEMLSSYPLGLAMIVLGVNIMAGFPTNWLVQMLPCLILVLLITDIQFRYKCWTDRGMILIVSLLPVTRWLSGGLYSEQLVAGCVLCGLKLLGARKTIVGALVMGSSAWFKLEGALVGGLLLCVRWLTDHCKDKFLVLIQFLVLLVPTVAWWCYLRCNQASVLDVDFRRVGFFAICRSLWEMVRMFDFALVSLISIPLLRSEHAHRKLLYLFATGVWFVGYAVVYTAFPESELKWHIGTSLPRQLWLWCLCWLYYDIDPERMA